MPGLLSTRMRMSKLRETLNLISTIKHTLNSKYLSPKSGMFTTTKKHQGTLPHCNHNGLAMAPFFWVILALILFWSPNQLTHSQNNTTSKAKAVPSTPDPQVLIGLEGFYRVGHWTGIRKANGEILRSIETRDGDGIQVSYLQPAEAKANSWSYVIPGSEAAPLIITPSNSDRIETRFPSKDSPSRRQAMIPLSMPWIVAIGDPLGIDELGSNELLNRDGYIAVSKPAHHQSLPDSSLGYDGVDLLIIGRSGKDLINNLSPEQQNAIIKWVTSGGHVLITLGASAPELFKQSPWLQELLPISEFTVEKIDPSAIETFTSSQTPLRPFDGVRLPNDYGETLLLGRTMQRNNTPIAVQYNLGLGRVIAVSGDLETAVFADWPERMDFLTQITGDILRQDSQIIGKKNRATAYDDLAGQLRTTLDQFDVKNRYSFSFLSIIVLLFLALIGPLDFLLLNRVLGKPILGWISFPFAAIGISLFLAYESRSLPMNDSADNTVNNLVSESESSEAKKTTTDETKQLNRLEVVDIDATVDSGITRSIHYLYSHRALQANVTITPSDSMIELADSIESQITAPFGYPGKSFGGIQLGVEDSRLPHYSIQLEDNFSSVSIEAMPVASRSSKGVNSLIEFKPKLSNRDAISRRPGSELLQGKLVNPLDVDILNGMLVYRNWTYILPTRFPAGSEIESLDSLRQKNFRWQLSRQKALESSSETKPWNPADTVSLDRIGEMILFHEAAGGIRYTNLNNAALSQLDFSHVLSSDRCILFGHLKDPATSMQLGNTENSNLRGTRQTFLRIVLPVSNELKSR